MKPGRNKPCPCGSGRKFNNCCLNSIHTKKSGDYFRLKGQNAETAVLELAKHSFLTDWCYPNPRWPDGKELCDLLVVFDSTAIIWQIKDLQTDEQGQPNPSEIQKNFQQLAGARRHLFELKRPITLTNPRRGPEPFEAARIKDVFLISALMGPTGAFMPFAEEFKKHTVHVMQRPFLDLALRELDTISDFTEYLRAKEALLKNLPRLAVLGGEEELLGHYLLSGRSFSSFKELHLAVLEAGFWDRLVRHPQYQAKKKADEMSYGWDSIIDRAHEGSSEYEPIARELARPNRFLRRYLAKVYFEAHVKAHRISGSACNVYRRVLPMDEDDVTYVFVFQDGPGAPRFRRDNLYATCLVARGKYRQNREVLGIATAMTIRPTCSYDYCFLDLPELSPELEADIKTFETKLGILQDVHWGFTLETEYPEIKPPSEGTD